MVSNLHSTEYEKILLNLLDDKFHLIILLSMTEFQAESSMSNLCVCVCETKGA